MDADSKGDCIGNSYDYGWVMVIWADTQNWPETPNIMAESNDHTVHTYIQYILDCFQIN